MILIKAYRFLVHVSPCGSHFVALLGGSRILIVPHFRNLVGQSEDVIYNAILDVQLSSPYSTRSIYLAYEEGDAGEGRVGVVTVSISCMTMASPGFLTTLFADWCGIHSHIATIPA